MSLLRKALIVGGLGVAASMTAKALLRHYRYFDWQGKRVLITGGSRGLGLCLARQLVCQQADVAICARSEEFLRPAYQQLSELAAGDSRVIAQSCDVRDSDSVQQFVDGAAGALGGVDVLINNAGVIEVGPLDAMTEQDFRDSMDTHCWGALNMVRASLPYFRAQRFGRILNIASLGGKRAVPHMLPYAASKFALVGLSEGLRAELQHENILVTTVCPGLMRTGSPRNATFKGQNHKEYTWFSIGDSLPLVSMDAEEAAAQILEACQNGDPEVVIAGTMNLSYLMSSLAPNWTREFMALMDVMLPEMGGIGQRAAKGYQSQSDWSPSWLTQLSQQAALRNNEFAG